MTGSQLEREIMEQPEVLEGLISSGRARCEEIARRIQEHSPASVLIAARGSSDNVARYAQYVFGANNRLPVMLATPSLFTLYNRPPALRQTVALAISQSGQSPDIVSVIEEAARQQCATIAITNDLSSPLARSAGQVLPLHAGAERSIAATKTYTTSLIAIAMISAALSGDSARFDEIKSIPQQVAQVLADRQIILRAAGEYRQAEAGVVLGRGFNYATAFEIALKLKELTYLLAEPFSSADFQHGPVALIEKGFLVIAVVPQGRVSDELMALVKDLQLRHPRLVILSDLDEALRLASTPVRLPPNVPEWLSPVVAVVAGQLFALGLTLAKGLDPDEPRGLRKVTRTH